MKPHLVAIATLALALTACDESAITRATQSRSTSAATAAPETSGRAEIAFVREGRPVRTLTRAEIEALGAETWTAFDPYYNKPKTFRAVPLAAILQKGFGDTSDALVKNDFVLRARDGYAVPVPGSKVLEKGGYIAIADVEVPGWEPIGQQRANPGPFYMVWREAPQQSLDTHPRPWQLASIEIAPFEATYPHTVPPATDAAATRGFRIFREQCISCHAINREGGRVGPDLNVPQSVVEYRPEPQIRAYIKDPRTFRYSNMPAHPSFAEADLDAIVAYFRAMKDRKHDPEAGSAGGH